MKNISNITTDAFNAIIEYKNSSNPNDYAMTQAEVAKAIGVSRIAIQQIETRALLKLKKELRRRNLATLELLI